MHVAIVGSGAVGGYYGAKLARAGHQVTFVARGAHRRAIDERGLVVWSVLGDFVARGAAVDDTTAVGPVDVVLFTVKTYDNPTALPLVRPLVGPGTVVLTLQNGVDSAEQVAAGVGREHVLAGATYIATALSAPGLIEQTGTHRRIVFGEVFGSQADVTPRVARLRDAFVDADIHGEAVADARVPLWEKFAYLAPFAAFTGAARLPIGPVWADEHAREKFIEASREVAAIARAEGVPLDDGLEGRMIKYMNDIPGNTRSSLLIDLSQGKRIEVEALQGAVVRRGRAAGVHTPVLSALYAVLRPHAEGMKK